MYIRKKKKHQIQGNNNLRKKNGWKPTYHKMLNSAIHELSHPFLAVITSHMNFNKKVPSSLACIQES
jgi:hypothetical protein